MNIKPFSKIGIAMVLAVSIGGCTAAPTGSRPAWKGAVGPRPLETKVGDRVFVTEVRSACSGGQPPALTQLRGWMSEPLTHGSLEYGEPYQKDSSVCPGRRLWMRDLYYRGATAGTDIISIRFPTAGLSRWPVIVAM